MTYYRLLQTDFGGESKVVGNVALERKANSTELPVSVTLIDNQLLLQFGQATAPAYYTTSVYDIAGRVVATETWLIDGTTQQTMDLTRLTEGVYFVSVNNANNLSAVFKIIITN